MDAGLRLAADGTPEPPLFVLELDEAMDDRALVHLAAAVETSVVPVVGVARTPLGPRFAELGSALTTTLIAEDHETAPWQAGVTDVEAALVTITATATAAPRAAYTLVGLLRLTSAATVPEGLTAESLAYSMLLAGPEFARWLEAYASKPILPRRSKSIPTGGPRDPTSPPVLLDRDDDALTITLNRPERHNAFGRPVRDGLAEGFDLVAADPTINRVLVTGSGASFCSGGDLDEFGLNRDLPTAHLIRVDRSVAARLDRVRERVTVVLHGACIGAGIELASYAGHVIARPDARIVLPELAMGLVPGAGGTVGITRRIGRWRTAYLALTGQPLPLDAALRWGLVDSVEQGHSDELVG